MTESPPTNTHPFRVGVEKRLVRLSFDCEDPVDLLMALEGVLEAEAILEINTPDLPSVELDPYEEKVAEAQDRLDHLLSVRLSPEEANALAGRIAAAAIHAKVNRGDFNK